MRWIRESSLPVPTSNHKPLSIPESEIELTADELAELEYYRNQPYFHMGWKCGEPLKIFSVKKRNKRHARFQRMRCTVHKVVVNMSGWEIGMTFGTDSIAMSKEKWIQKKHRFNNS